MAFLEVVTRTYKRPAGLARNRASLAAQSDPDWTQTLLVDDIGIGVEAANARLADVEPVGDYVWVLDDDDYCTRDDLVERLKSIVYAMLTPPAAIVVRMDHGSLGVLPDVGRFWGMVPPEGGIGCSALVTRADVWRQYREWWRTGRYAADYDFTAAVLRNETHVVWVDVVASAVSRRSVGRAEVPA